MARMGAWVEQSRCRLETSEAAPNDCGTMQTTHSHSSHHQSKLYVLITYCKQSTALVTYGYDDCDTLSPSNGMYGLDPCCSDTAVGFPNACTSRGSTYLGV